LQAINQVPGQRPMDAFVAAEIAANGKVIKAAGIK
jgi:hypothetical protein